jgi:molybdate transport system ATP-binding protein
VLNILAATVADITPDGPGQVLVGLTVAAANRDMPTDTRLLSRISQASAHRLALAPGVAVFAQIKGVAIVR